MSPGYFHLSACWIFSHSPIFGGQGLIFYPQNMWLLIVLKQHILVSSDHISSGVFLQKGFFFVHVTSSILQSSMSGATASFSQAVDVKHA